MTITITALIFVICQPYSIEAKCEKYLNQCVKQNLQTPYVKQYKPEVGKARTVIGCAKKGDFLRRPPHTKSVPKAVGVKVRAIKATAKNVNLRNKRLNKNSKPMPRA